MNMKAGSRLLLAGAAALALAGCGGGSNDAASSAASAAAQAGSQAQAQAASIQSQAASMAAQAQSQAAELQSQALGMASSAQAQASSAQAQASSAASEAEAMASSALSAATADEGSASSTSASEPAVAGPYAPGGFAAIVAQLDRKLGYKPKVLQVVLSADYAQFQVQDARKPKNVDQYEWRDGQIGDPIPVKLIGDGDLAANVFPLASLAPTGPRRLKAAGEALSIDGAAVSTMIAKRNLPFAADVTWFVNVSGTREDKQLRANAAGKVLKVV